MLVTPEIDHPSAFGNMRPFENGKHLIYYDPNDPNRLREILEYYAANPSERDDIAKAGFDEVRSRHTLSGRFDTILADAERFIQAQGSQKVAYK
jgi:spore maturation protein CgeB